MFTVVTVLISSRTRQRGQIQNNAICTVVTTTKVEIVHAKLRSIRLLPDINTQISLGGNQASVCHCDCCLRNRTSCFLESDLHTVPSVVFNVNLILPIVRVVILHERDQLGLGKAALLALH